MSETNTSAPDNSFKKIKEPTPLAPSVVAEHSTPQSIPRSASYFPSSKASLFNLFRGQSRRPSVSAESTSNASTYSNIGTFTNASIAGADLETPRKAIQAGSKVQKILRATKEYRKAIDHLQSASLELGTALYDFSEVKAAKSTIPERSEHDVSSDMSGAGGLHLLIADHLKILTTTMKTQVESPLFQIYNGYKLEVQKKENEFRMSLSSKLNALKKGEQHRIKESRNRDRDLLAYRNSLQDLTSQIDDINKVKFEFLSDLYELESKLAEDVHLYISKAVTAEIEIFDVISRKGWSGSGLDGLLAGCPDPFENLDNPEPNVPNSQFFSLINSTRNIFEEENLEEEQANNRESTNETNGSTVENDLTNLSLYEHKDDHKRSESHNGQDNT